MNTIDLINKISVTNGITTGRAEMIVGIIIEKITDKLKREGEVYIENFGHFRLEPKSNFDSKEVSFRNQIVFEPDNTFLDSLNS